MRRYDLADWPEASRRLAAGSARQQAQQVRQQLALYALGIANEQPRLLLQLFR